MNAIRWFFRNPDTGRIVIAQPPNLPLALFLAATAVRVVADPEGTPGTIVAVTSRVGLVWWALLEIARGDSPFRRVLGAVVMVATMLSVLT